MQADDTDVCIAGNKEKDTPKGVLFLYYILVGIYLHLTTFISFASALAKVEFIAMPNEESVLTLMGSVAMDHKAYDRILPNITCDTQLFPE